jgi:hypothetical protein
VLDRYLSIYIYSFKREKRNRGERSVKNISWAGRTLNFAIMAGWRRERRRGADNTPTWIAAAVCSVIVVISLLLERMLHRLGKVRRPVLRRA